MTTYTDDERHVLMDDAMRGSALSRFRSINGAAIDRLIATMTSAVDYLGLLQHGFSIVSLFSHRIETGLLTIFKGDKDSDPMFNGSDIAYFFMHYFAEEYEQSDSSGKAELLRSLYQYASQDHGLAPLFFELSVARSFRLRGHQVQRIPRVEDKKTPDLQVQSRLETLFIECKCVSSESGSPIPKSVRESAGRRVIAHLESLTALADGSLVLTARYVGTRETEGLSELAELDDLLSRVHGVGDFAKGKHWEIFVEKIPANPSSLNATELLRKSSVFSDGNETTALVAIIPSKGIIRLQSTHSSKLSRAIAKTVDSAMKQLPAGRLGVIWLQIIGIVPLSDNSQEYSGRLLTAVLESGDTRRRLMREFKKYGFAGIHVVGDFFSNEIEEGVHHLDYFGTSIGQAGAEATNLYWFDFLKKLPSDMKSGGVSFDELAARSEHVWL